MLGLDLLIGEGHHMHKLASPHATVLLKIEYAVDDCLRETDVPLTLVVRPAAGRFGSQQPT
jgi:hypothetical protein